MDSTDLIVNKDNNGNVISLGYEINNNMLKNNQPISIMKGGEINFIESLKLGNLAVPVGLFYLQDTLKHASNSFNNNVFELYDNNYDSNEYNDIKYVDNTLYEKLLNIMNINKDNDSKLNTTKFTKKHRKTKIAKKTRKTNP